MILIKVVMKHLQVFLSRISKFGRLAYISVPIYLDRVYGIEPIKRLRKKN